MKKVLIIAHDETLLDTIDYLLIGFGLKVYSGTEQMEIDTIISLQPKLIILEPTVDHENENAFFLKLKLNEFTKHISILMISTHTGLKSMAEISHADAHINMPFNLDNFERIVDELIFRQEG